MKFNIREEKKNIDKLQYKLRVQYTSRLRMFAGNSITIICYTLYRNLDLCSITVKQIFAFSVIVWSLDNSKHLSVFKLSS